MVTSHVYSRGTSVSLDASMAEKGTVIQWQASDTPPAFGDPRGGYDFNA